MKEKLAMSAVEWADDNRRRRTRFRVARSAHAARQEHDSTVDDANRRLRDRSREDNAGEGETRLVKEGVGSRLFEKGSQSSIDGTGAYVWDKVAASHKRISVKQYFPPEVLRLRLQDLSSSGTAERFKGYDEEDHVGDRDKDWWSARDVSASATDWRAGSKTKEVCDRADSPIDNHRNKRSHSSAAYHRTKASPAGLFSAAGGGRPNAANSGLPLPLNSGQTSSLPAIKRTPLTDRPSYHYLRNSSHSPVERPERADMPYRDTVRERDVDGIAETERDREKGVLLPLAPVRSASSSPATWQPLSGSASMSPSSSSRRDLSAFSPRPPDSPTPSEISETLSDSDLSPERDFYETKKSIHGRDREAPTGNSAAREKKLDQLDQATEAAGCGNRGNGQHDDARRIGSALRRATSARVKRVSFADYESKGALCEVMRYNRDGPLILKDENNNNPNTIEQTMSSAPTQDVQKTRVISVHVPGKLPGDKSDGVPLRDQNKVTADSVKGGNGPTTKRSIPTGAEKHKGTPEKEVSPDKKVKKKVKVSRTKRTVSPIKTVVQPFSFATDRRKRTVQRPKASASSRTGDRGGKSVNNGRTSETPRSSLSSGTMPRPSFSEQPKGPLVRTNGSSSANIHSPRITANKASTTQIISGNSGGTIVNGGSGAAPRGNGGHEISQPDRRNEVKMVEREKMSSVSVRHSFSLTSTSSLVKPVMRAAANATAQSSFGSSDANDSPRLRRATDGHNHANSAAASSLSSSSVTPPRVRKPPPGLPVRERETAIASRRR